MIKEEYTKFDQRVYSAKLLKTLPQPHNTLFASFPLVYNEHVLYKDVMI